MRRSSGTSAASFFFAPAQNSSKSAGEGLPFFIFSGSNAAVKTNASLFVRGSVSRRKPGLSSDPETLNFDPFAMSNVSFAMAFGPKLSSVTSCFAASLNRFAVSSTVTVKVAVSPQRYTHPGLSVSTL